MKAAYVYYAMEEKAASTKQMLKTCEALGERVELEVFSTPNIGEASEFYDVRRTFSYKKKSSPESNSVALEALKRLSFGLKTYFEVRSQDFDTVYTPDIAFLCLMRILPSETPVFYEAHNPYNDTNKIPTFLEEEALKEPVKAFCVSEGVRDALVDKGLDAERLEVLRNGVGQEYFPGDKGEASTGGQVTVVYLGSFKDRKGVKTLVEAFGLLGEGFKLELIGGSDADQELIERIEADESISLRTDIPEKKLPELLSRGDILVHPSEDTEYQRKFTSPMKLFEYLATGKPIVAADLPTTREVAGKTVRYFEAGNSKDLTAKIEKAAEEDANSKSAIERAKNFTWEKRAERLQKAMQQKS